MYQFSGKKKKKKDKKCYSFPVKTYPNFLAISADEKFNVPGKIVSASLYWDLMSIGQIKYEKNQPTFKKTLLGWVVSGMAGGLENKEIHKKCHISISEQLNESLKKFWELEHGLLTINLSPEEQACEDSYAKNTYRDKSGRFVVQLPVKPDVLCKIGESKKTAYKLLLSLERRLKKSPDTQQQYSKFLKEYQDLGHMREVTEAELATKSKVYYMPHHCVINENSTSTKLRVVFNASCKSSTNVSLNDALMIGPTLQGDLFSRLLEFRTFEYVFTADIPKMYRQILVNPN